MGIYQNEDMQVKFSFVVPYYNEELIIEQNIGKIIGYLEIQFGSSYELILSNDNSNDHSPEIAEEFRINPRIRLVDFSTGPSHRENLSEALKMTKGDIVCFFDIDLSSDISSLKYLIRSIETDGFDIAIGGRRHPLSIVRRSLGRRLVSRFYNMIIRILFGSEISDHQCGFKAFKKSVLQNLLSEMGYDPTFRRRWFWDTELLLRAQRKNYRIKELPVKWNGGLLEEGGFAFVRKEYVVIFYILKNYKNFK